MGLTAALIACRVGAEPAAVGSWTPFSDVAEGWLLRRGWMVGENAEGLAGLLGGVVGPALAAFVVDSDFCVVVGAVDGTVAWRWVFNKERVYDEVGAARVNLSEAGSLRNHCVVAGPPSAG
jgi:MFS family permease